VRRWWLWVLVVCLVIVVLGVLARFHVAGAEWGLSNLPPALWLDDHYLNLDLTDVAATTAAVDTSPPGKVLLPRRAGEVMRDVVALRPGALQVAVVVKDGLQGYAFDGVRMVRDGRLDTALREACAVSFTSDGGFLVAATRKGQVVFWGFDSEGSLHEVQRLSGFSEVVAVEPAVGWDVWVGSKKRAWYLGFDGTKWQEVPALALSLSEARSASWYGQRRSLTVLDGTRVRYFAWEGSRFVEVGAFSTDIGSASAVVQHGLGYSVLQDKTVLAYGLTEAGVVRCPSLDFTFPDAAEGLAGSPWADQDWVGLTGWGMRYVGWTGTGWAVDPARSVAGVSVISEVPAGRYEEAAEYRSRLLDAVFPVFKVRLEAEAFVPRWCSVEYFVTTDGSNWTQVEPGVSTEVPEGMKLGYRIRLATARPELPKGPEVDRVRLLQIAYRYLPVSQAGKVRLVR